MSSPTAVVSTADLEDAIGYLRGLLTILYRFVEVGRHGDVDWDLFERLGGLHTEDVRVFEHIRNGDLPGVVLVYEELTALRERLFLAFGEAALDGLNGPPEGLA